MNKNTGFITEKRSPEDYVLGGLSKSSRVALNIKWSDHLPIKENQARRGVDTISCVSFTTLNVIEILLKAQFGKVSNYADRFLAVISETTPRGNSPSKVGQALRKKGAIPETMLPFSSDIKSFRDYHSPIPKRLYREAKKFLAKYEVKHEWVDTDPQSLMEALTLSPVGISVYAWRKDNYYIRPNNVADGHYTCLVDYKENEYWIVYDSYLNDGDPIKYLAWDYWREGKSIAKGYSLEKKKNDNWLNKLLKMLKLR